MISLSKVKEMLGLNVTTYDTQITALLPVVKADVKRILNHNFHERIWATIVDGESDFVYAQRPLDNPIEFGRLSLKENLTLYMRSDLLITRLNSVG